MPIWYFNSYGDSFNEGVLPNSIYTFSFETLTYQAQFLGSGFSKVSMQEGIKFRNIGSSPPPLPPKHNTLDQSIEGTQIIKLLHTLLLP